MRSDLRLTSGIKRVGAIAILSVCSGGCFSCLLDFGSAWKGGSSAGDKVVAATFDVVTMPVQLPFWIVVGLGYGLSDISRNLEVSSWESKRKEMHAKFLKDPVKMQQVAPEFSHRGASFGLVYMDEAIPLSENFLVEQVVRYYTFAHGGWLDKDEEEEIAALMHRRDWTSEGLRAIAPLVYFGRSCYPPPDYVALAYLSNPRTPRDIVENFARHPNFLYRNAKRYCPVMRDEIMTNILAHVEAGSSAAEGSSQVDASARDFGEFLKGWLGRSYGREADWRTGGGMWDPCAVGTPRVREEFVLGGVRAGIVELYGAKPEDWSDGSEFRGAVGAMTLEFANVAERDRFLRAAVPVCRFCGPECWEQLVFAPMDEEGSVYGICLEREKKSDGTSSRIFIIDLKTESEIRFWPPREYQSRHIWFADTKS